ncbi:helicase associated domain-containing protein [Prevotella communis]|uniref:helicase associated domain-containing protein n=1 Tax=Prevotella communis TaxID=2913614 RepID=UPI001EDB7EA8|nr:helicase associated domain-containing protein [Prevotella communis]UKK67623.1 helicase associated domain-containing protein [Prevotella communis]UKK70230.1 helicase associated domain-containing protein [Prevotella communis]
MTQDERWLTRYHEVVEFIEANHRNPSKHRIEEHDMLNWVKANRKVMNAGKMRPERVEAFGRLMALMEEYKRKNQYE